MTQLEQAKSLIEKAQNILIFLPEDYTRLNEFAGRPGDVFCSGAALLHTLRKGGKNVNALIGDAPSKFQFLGNFDNSSPLRKFTISINSSGKDISELRYEKNENNLKIHLALKEGEIEERDISFGSINFNKINTEAELIITVGVKSLEDIGYSFEQSPSLFYETPILNIDNSPKNENYGEVNLIEITTISLSEIITDLIKQVDKSLFSKNIATLLLSGIISASQNFQSSKVQPKTFDVASFLLENEANHQIIIHNLYRQKSLPQIKLLGKILEKLEFYEKKELYLAVLTKNDFQETNSKPKDLGEVLEELRTNFYKFSSLLLLWEGNTPNI